MLEFKESKFYKLLQDFSLNNDKETFLQMLAEFYNKTEGIIDKNNLQDEVIKELRELYIKFNEEGIDENIVREKVEYFLENNVKIKDTFVKLIKNLNKIENNIINSTYENNALFTFIDDDCMPTFVSKMKPILENNNIKCSLALPTSQVGKNGTMDLNQLKSLDNEGYEILSHGHNKILMNVSETEMHSDLKTAKEKFKEYGFKNNDILVYNGGNYNNNEGRIVKKVVRNYYKYAFNNFGSNNLIVDNFMVGRVDFNTKTIEELKTEVDNAIKYRSYLVFMVHSWQDTFNTEKLDNIIKYIKSKKMEIVTASSGVKRKCNQIDIGESNSYGGTRINSNGMATINYMELDSTTINREIKDYPLGVSYINLPSYVAGVTPQPSGLKDYNWSGYSSFITVVKNSLTSCTQYLTLNFTKRLQYCRTWKNTNSKWTEFNPMFSYVNIGVLANTDIKKNITNYDKNVITEFYCAGGSNTPNSKPCIIQVHRFDDDAYSYMECIPHDEAKKYKSKWNDGTKTWGEWVLY